MRQEERRKIEARPERKKFVLLRRPAGIPGVGKKTVNAVLTSNNAEHAAISKQKKEGESKTG